MGVYAETTPNQYFFISSKDFESCYKAMCRLNTTHHHEKTGGNFAAGGSIHSNLLRVRAGRSSDRNCCYQEDGISDGLPG
eukprot:1224146-Rhodomonas_salina.2